ncbi:MAG: type IV pilus twitching motility protein PilT [Nitrospiria bacterium]
MTIETLLKASIDKGASDLHLKVGAAPMIRVNGLLRPLEGFPKLNQESVVQLSAAVMNPVKKAEFKENREIDLAYSAAGLGRFRVNIFLQRGTIGAAFRVIPVKISSIEELLLPPVLEKLALEQRGLIVVTGTTGSGKSTTLASMIDTINQNRAANIITIEDPIEFLHRDKKGIVSQREVGADVDSFDKALRSALRQDPDVILVGEMRDFETISTALTAAETGHLVLSTLHTLDTTETINRIISVFPPYHQDQIREQLASVIRGSISMRLIPRADQEGRVPAVEVMVATQTIREAVIHPEKTRNISTIISAGKSQYGMQTFDQSIFDLYEAGRVSYDEALKWTSNPDDFALKVKGVQTTGESWKESQDKKQDDAPEFEIERF